MVCREFTAFDVNYDEVGPFEFVPDEKVKDLIFEQIAGFSGSATAVSYCSTEDFLTLGITPADCEDRTAVGVSAIALFFPPSILGLYVNQPIYNLEPPPGVVVRIGFKVAGVPQIVDVGVKDGGDYNVVATADRISQVLAVFGGAVQLWGVPADPAHDPLRGKCIPLGPARKSTSPP